MVNGWVTALMRDAATRLLMVSLYVCVCVCVHVCLDDDTWLGMAHTHTHTHQTHTQIHTKTHLGSVKSGTPLHKISTPEVCELNTGLSSERFAIDLTSR